jgi:hypothetical protein
MTHLSEVSSKSGGMAAMTKTKGGLSMIRTTTCFTKSGVAYECAIEIENIDQEFKLYGLKGIKGQTINNIIMQHSKEVLGIGGQGKVKCVSLPGF